MSAECANNENLSAEDSEEAEKYKNQANDCFKSMCF